MVGFLFRLKLFCMERLSFLTSIFKESKYYYNIVQFRTVLYKYLYFISVKSRKFKITCEQAFEEVFPLQSPRVLHKHKY